jgi:hypothetical protein
MREFNISGPCNPELHYTIKRDFLIADAMDKVRKGRYFTVFAPRQTGKTTLFQLLFNELDQSWIKPIHVRFASLKHCSREEFYKALMRKITVELTKHKIQTKVTITSANMIEYFFQDIHKQYSIKIFMVIDEFEGIPSIVLNEFMHALRDMYHQKENHVLHSMMLVGVSTIAELVHTKASPFNVAEEIEVSYFNETEMNELIDQYVAETHQDFDSQVRKAIFHNTNGQPGLVCGLCKYLVEKVAVDRTKPITMDIFWATLKYYMTVKYDTNIINVVQKAAKQKDFILKLLFDERPCPFTVHNPQISFLYANGVVHNDNGNTVIGVPLYQKALIEAFRPDFNGEVSHYSSTIQDTFQSICIGKKLNIKALIEKYTDYIKRRGFLAFDTKNLKESAWHYSLDGYINFAIEELQGHTFIEVPSGRGRTDILIIYKKEKYIIETKIYTTNKRYQNGKAQLAQYLKSEGLTEGFFVVFSQKHTENDVLYEEDIIDEKKIYTFVIRTSFEIPSRVDANQYNITPLKPAKKIIYTPDFFNTKNKIIYISYSVEDREWLNRLLYHLMPLKHENIDFWFDHQPEKNNFRAIENSINRSHLIICLITQNFLNKESIRTKEIPLIKIRQTENIPVVPLLFEKCLWTINSWLNSMTLYPTTKKPVAEYELDEQDNLLMDIVGELFLRLKN